MQPLNQLLQIALEMRITSENPITLWNRPLKNLLPPKRMATSPTRHVPWYINFDDARSTYGYYDKLMEESFLRKCVAMECHI